MCKLWFCCCFVAFFIKVENSFFSFCAKACFTTGIALKLTTCNFQNEHLDSHLCRFLIQKNKSHWVVSGRSGRWFSQGSFGFCRPYTTVFNPQAHEQMIWLFQEIHCLSFLICNQTDWRCSDGAVADKWPLGRQDIVCNGSKNRQNN